MKCVKTYKYLLTEEEIRKIIVVPNKIVNLVV